MNKVVLPCFFVVVLLTAAIGGLAPSSTEVKAQSNTLTTTQQTGIMWNNTDRVYAYAQNFYPENETFSPRIIVEYGDFSTRNNIVGGLPNFTFSPRITTEYADAASQLSVQSFNGLSVAVASRILIEDADYASYVTFPVNSYQGPNPVRYDDVAVINVSCPKTVVGQGCNCSVIVTLLNQGNFTESFNLTTNAGAMSIENQTINSMLGGTLNTLTFVWNASSIVYGNYTLSAYANLTDANMTNNSYSDGQVVVSIPGDINGDFKVSLADLVLLANAYGTTPISGGKPGFPRAWNANADINGDGKVSLADLVILADYYGSQYP